MREAITRALSDPALPIGAARVLLCLLAQTASWSRDRERLSVDHIANDAGVSRASVYRALNRLEKLGAIQRISRPGARCEYRLPAGNPSHSSETPPSHSSETPHPSHSSETHTEKAVTEKKRYEKEKPGRASLADGERAGSDHPRDRVQGALSDCWTELVDLVESFEQAGGGARPMHESQWDLVEEAFDEVDGEAVLWLAYDVLRSSTIRNKLGTFLHRIRAGRHLEWDEGGWTKARDYGGGFAPIPGQMPMMNVIDGGGTEAKAAEPTTEATPMPFSEWVRTSSQDVPLPFRELLRLPASTQADVHDDEIWIRTGRRGNERAENEQIQEATG